ncbi:MAG: hypothetical protein WAS27_00835 [Candidatus Saccharimonadales bacterium]
MNTHRTVVELFGWIGTLLILGSYGLLSFGIVDGNSILYHTFVLIGAIGVALISYYKQAYQPLVLNGIFALLASFAIIRLLFLH